MVIYIDVLFLINLYVTYFEILGVCAFTHRKAGRLRMIAAALLGGLCSFVIFLPQDMVILSTLIKIASCFVITLIVFGYGGFLAYVKSSLLMLFVNFVFAGLMLAVWFFAAPMKMLYSNGTVYFDIDFMTILICTAAAYTVLRIIRFFLDKNGKEDGEYKVTIENNGKSCVLSALSDTANGLVDYFSGLPVIICRQSACADVSPPNIRSVCGTVNADELCSTDIKGIRVLPFSTVCAAGYVYAFKADKITVSDKKSGKSYNVNALIGIAPQSRQEYDAIFNPKILV